MKKRFGYYSLESWARILRPFVFLMLLVLSCHLPLWALTSGQQRPADPAAVQQPQAGSFKAPDNLDFRTASVISEGVRLHAELFSLKSLAGKSLPTIIMAHGWGGTA